MVSFLVFCSVPVWGRMQAPPLPRGFRAEEHSPHEFVLSRAPQLVKLRANATRTMPHESRQHPAGYTVFSRLPEGFSDVASYVDDPIPPYKPADMMDQEPNHPVAGYSCGLITPEEMELFNLVTKYRDVHGLQRVTYGKHLSAVARIHCEGQGMKPTITCADVNDFHGWQASSRADVDLCCFDHGGNPGCMWSKPAQISEGVMMSAGYEIAFEGPNRPESIMHGWMHSTLHNNVIINEGSFQHYRWKSIGVGICPGDPVGFANIWFSEMADPCDCRTSRSLWVRITAPVLALILTVPVIWVSGAAIGLA